MKDPKPAPLTALDPSHPNHDAILLKRSRLEAHRRRRQENRNALHAAEEHKGGAGQGGKPPRRRNGR